jgi:hypothetical protein
MCQTKPISPKWPEFNMLREDSLGGAVGLTLERGTTKLDRIRHFLQVLNLS